MNEAWTVYQANLDAVTRLFLTGEVDQLADHLGVPAELRTIDGWVWIETFAQLLEMLGEQRASLRRLGATDYLRICKSARFTDAARTCIDATHETHILRGGNYVMPPYPCEQTLRLCEDGKWRSFRIACKLRNIDYTVIGQGAPARPPSTLPDRASGSQGVS